jgi:carbon storage regulator
MLVLTRKLNEKIVIGEDLVLTVVEIQRGRVRLGFEAPKQISIMRQELLGGPAPGCHSPSEPLTPDPRAPNPVS